jgi:hypothetical protein
LPVFTDRCRKRFQLVARERTEISLRRNSPDSTPGADHIKPTTR